MQLPGGLQGLRIALRQRLRPLTPVAPVVGIGQGHEQGIVGQPVGVRLLERRQVRPLMV